MSWWAEIKFARNCYKKIKDSFQFPHVEGEVVEILNLEGCAGGVARGWSSSL